MLIRLVGPFATTDTGIVNAAIQASAKIRFIVRSLAVTLIDTILYAPQEWIEELLKEWNDDIRPRAELVSESVNKPNRPTQALEFVSMLRH